MKDRSYSLLKGEGGGGGGGKYANAKMQKLRGVLFCTKHSLALASGTWMFTEAGCLDTDIYMRLLIVSQLG